MKLFSIEDMIAAEKTADFHNHPYATMMELAGKGVADAIMQRIDVVNKRVIVLIGTGNNGGDGLVVAHHLSAAGATVICYLYKPRDSSDVNFARVKDDAIDIITFSEDEQQHKLRLCAESCDVLVDGLLGIGVSRPIGNGLAKLMRQTKSAVEQRSVNQAPTQLTLSALPNPTKSNKPYVVAIDVPSGVNADKGSADPLTLAADLTVTFAGPKRGHFSFPAADLCGEVAVVDIGIQAKHTAHLPVNVADAQLMGLIKPKRPLNGHKGTFGNVLIAAGSRDYLGAPVLAARGALRAGAGVVSLAVPQLVRASAASNLPEASFPFLPDESTLTAMSLPKLKSYMQKADAFLLGPGMGSADTFMHVLLQQEYLPPLVVDADALNILSRDNHWHKRLPPNSILTPHPGEMARLLHVPTEELVKLDRIGLAMETAVSWNQIVVLKGAYTIIASPNDTATIIPIAHPALAVGGSGDVLAGIIAALVAQGLAPYDAARLGAYLHAVAGQHVAVGQAGLLASDIANAVPDALNML